MAAPNRPTLSPQQLSELRASDDVRLQRIGRLFDAAYGSIGDEAAEWASGLYHDLLDGAPSGEHMPGGQENPYQHIIGLMGHPAGVQVTAHDGRGSGASVLMSPREARIASQYAGSGPQTPEREGALEELQQRAKAYDEASRRAVTSPDFARVRAQECRACAAVVRRNLTTSGLRGHSITASDVMTWGKTIMEELEGEPGGGGPTDEETRIARAICGVP